MMVSMTNNANEAHRPAARSRNARRSEVEGGRSMDVEYDEDKFTEMLLYVASRLRDDHAGGATKLNKALYFADFAHVRRHGRPITGAVYQKLERGPAPRRLVPVRQRLVESGDAQIVREDFLGYEQHRLIPLREPDLSLFSAAELGTIDSVLDDLDGMTGAQVSELSHEEPPWRYTEPGESIRHETAFIAKEQIVTPAAHEMAQRVAARYGIATE
jgi:uncharacterized phage-associated protein